MRKIKLFLSMLMLIAFSVGNVWGADESVTFSEQGYTNQQEISSYTGTDFSIAFNKGTNNNAPKYFTSGTAIRAYGGNYFTVSSTKTIAKIELTFGSSDGSNAITTNVATYSDGTWNGSATSVQFTIGGTSGNRRLAGVAVTFAGADPVDVDVTEVTLDEDEIALEVGEKQTLTATVLPDNATNKNVTWESDDTDVATVENGLVTAVAPGTATITCKSADDATISATCDVTVTAAEVPTLTFDFSAKGYENGVQYSSIDADDNITITFGDSNNDGKYYTTGTAMRVYGGGHMTVAGGEGVTISKILLEFGSGDGSNAISTTVGTYAAGKWTGSEQSVTFSVGGSSGNRRIKVVKVFYEAEAIAVAKPTISGVTPFLTSTTVTLTQAEADHIYYTTNGNEPTTSSTEYTVPFELNATATVKAIAVKGSDVSEVAEATFTKATILTVAEALVEATGEGKYVTGTITSITEVNIGYKNATYVISDISAGVKQNEMIVYRGKYINGADFTSADQIHVGDVVVVSGSIAVHAEKNQMAQGNQIETISAAAVAAPEFTPNGGGFMGETDVTITCATAGSDIYYTTDGTNPTNLSTLYEGAIHLNTTTTITAIAYVGEESSLVVAKEFTLTAPMTVAEAYDALTGDDINKAAVAGIVYQVDNISSGHATYWISDNGEAGEKVLEVYNGYGLNGASIAAGGIQAGDEVTVFGNLTIFNSTTKEFASGSRLLAFNRPEVAVTSVELDQNAASIEVNETVTLHATVNPDNASNKAITWSVQSGSEYATVDAGVVTGILAGGTAVIRAASTEDPTKYAECTVTVTAVDPTVHHVTFIAGTDKSDETSITKDGITISATTFNNDSYYQCYANSAMTVSSAVGNITKIELTCTASGTAKYGPGNWDFTGYSYDGTNGSWAGSAETVEFGTASQQVRMTLITVTYKEDNRAAAGLAWNPADDIEITVGDAFSAPTLLNPNSIDAAEITIESSNTSLATVTAGVVSLVADATGTATITATFNGNDDYKPATVSYNITVNEAGLDNVTFDSSEDHAESGETTITKGGFTLSFTSGSMDGTQAEYRLYKSQTMTLSSTDYLIKKIEFTCTSGNPISGFADATGLDKDNNEWTGESSMVELTASNAQVRMTKIKVFYVDDTRAAAGLAWNPADDIEITVGDAFSAPALLNPNSIDASEITIESSNTDLATVTAGEVALVADATGTTTITATFAGNDDFKPATVSYKITVNPAYSIYVQPSLNVNFGSVNQNAEVADKKVTVTFTNVPAATLTLAGAGASAFTISPAAAMTASGDITISASSANVGTFAATLTISDDANNAESKVVNISITVNEPVVAETAVATDSKWVPATEIVNGMQVLIVGERNEKIYAVGAQTSNNRTAVEGSLSEGVFTPGENTMAFTVVAQEGGTYALQASNGKYLYAAGSGSGKNYLRSQDEVDDNAKWTLSVSSATANGTNTNNKLQLNNSSDIFSCYSSTQKAIALYVPKPVVTYVAQIGETMYESLPAAVAAAQDGQTVELLMDVAAGPGVMITTAEHKQIIIDFGNHTYCANSPAVGSAGTQNQAFHFEKGCNITLQNGTITSIGDEIIMLIQNYGDLTLTNITLIGNNLPGTHRYVLSNNCGTVVIGDGTTITAKEGDVAFDVCVTNYYPEGTQVTVEDGATITGIVEYDVWGTIPADNKATLTIEGGNFNITWNVESALAEDAKDNINVEGGIFNAEVPADYCAHGYIPKDNGNGQYGVHYAGYYERGSLTPGNYATICLPNGGKISGASLFDIEYYENSTLYLLEVEGNAMVAGRPYIFLPSSDKIEVTYTDAVSATAGSFNGLVGSLSLVAEVITPNDGNYILYNNQYYFVNSEAYVGANRAYIHMDDVPTEPSTPQVGQAPRRRVAMNVNGEQVATGIGELNASETPVKMIIDGQLFIIRGEKMYNVNGQVVK